MLLYNKIPGAIFSGMASFTATQEKKSGNSLFSLQIPNSYEAISGILSYMHSSKKDLLAGLNMLAELNDRIFPDMTGSLDEQFEKYAIRCQLSQERRAKLMRRMVLMRSFLHSRQWKYLGQGVKFGESGTPVLWYKAKGKELYRMVYADLGIEKVGQQCLPDTPPACEAANRQLKICDG